jgi:hypothetical protein
MLMVARVSNYFSIFFIVACICPFASAQTTNQIGLEFVRLTKTSFTRVEKGGVLSLRASVRNTSNEPAIGYLVGKLTGQTGEEDSRRIELKAGEYKDFEMQFRVSPKAEGPQVTAVVTLNVIENGREIMLQRGEEPLSRTLSVNTDTDRFATATSILQDQTEIPTWRWPPKERYAQYELILATRVDSGLSRRCLHLDNENMPISSLDWQAIDSLVIGKPETFDDAVAMGAIKSFLSRGGKVLVLLDEIDTKLVRDLMSPDQQCETVDTVELNQFVMDIRSPIEFSEADRTMQFDKPVRFKRVFQQGGRVTHSIDGWPAAVSMKVGAGELILTALESRVWLQTRAVHRSQDPYYRSDFTAPLWASTLTSALSSAPAMEPLDAKEVSYPTELIGTPIASRNVMGATLIGFCLLLVGVGVWNSFSGDLKRIGWLAPLLALACSIPIFVASSWSRSEIPPMSSELQIVQFWPTGGGLLRSKAAVTIPESRSMDLVGEADGFAIASENIESGVRRLTTLGFQNWQLSNSNWPPGTWRYQSEVALTHPSLSAKSRLTSKGLEIEMPEGMPSLPEDVVVNFSLGLPCLGKWTEPTKRLLVDGSLSAEGGRWTSDAIVSDEQGRRAKVYNEVFLNAESNRIAPVRTLYFWTSLWPQSPVWKPRLERRGAALVSVPIELETPQVGATILVPHSLIQIAPQTENISTMYNHRMGRWGGEFNSDKAADLSFLLPPEVVPLEATSIHIDLNVVAPKRTVRIVSSAGDAPIELVRLNSPSIPWQGTIDNPRVLQDLVDGRLDLKVEVIKEQGLSESENQDSFIGWEIKHLYISVHGKMLPRNNLVSTTEK